MLRFRNAMTAGQRERRQKTRFSTQTIFRALQTTPPKRPAPNNQEVPSLSALAIAGGATAAGQVLAAKTGSEARGACRVTARRGKPDDGQEADDGGDVELHIDCEERGECCTAGVSHCSPACFYSIFDPCFCDFSTIGSGDGGSVPQPTESLPDSMRFSERGGHAWTKSNIFLLRRVLVAKRSMW
ncbi:hypothetical protein FA95DRAFT_1114541 [Auriscalpium vulgare]|uniref:Uncharacterized protein n=1 Tax=Auriscalpium vulgare TaxID=40419 RepID=A0ACB8R5V6_9AGAM|nr:hypothetical protein FA95DRAFT_1114541 [Auriscalpium vulgare]